MLSIDPTKATSQPNTSKVDERKPRLIAQDDAENGALRGAMSGDENAIGHFRRHTKPEDFQNPERRKITEALAACFEANKAYDADAVDKYLQEQNETQACVVLLVEVLPTPERAPDFRDCVYTVKNWQRTPEAKAARNAAQRETLEANGLPVIETNDRQDIDKLRDLSEAIAAYNGDTPTVFHGIAGLTEIARDKDGQPIARPMSREALQVLAGKAAVWISTTTREGVRNVAAPRDLCEKFNAAPQDWQNIPPLDGIKTAPFVDADGTICATAGYHRAARVWLNLPHNFKLPDTTPTPANIDAAKHLILSEILGEVAFANDKNASRAHAVALMILPFVRRLIRGQTPQHLFNAPTQSSGKTYTASTCIRPFCEAIPSPEKVNAEENRKSLFAQAATGCSHIFVDNIKASQSDPTLAAAITSGKLQERLIGTGQMVTIETNVVWVATSNNAQLDRDAVSRSILIQLDTNEENPEGREYQGDPLQFIADNRAQVIGAILTLVRNWQQQGSQPKTGRCKSRFKQWEQIIGGILEANEISGLLENFEESRAALDPEADAWREFVAEWHTEHGEDYVTAKQLLPLALKTGEISALIGGDEKTQSRRFGQMLTKQKDRIFGSFKIQRGSGNSGKGAKWRLLAIKSPENTQKGANSANSANTLTPVRDVKNTSETQKQLMNFTSRIEQKALAPLALLAPFDAETDIFDDEEALVYGTD